MKKLFFLFALILYIVSCKGASQSIINPLATRTVEVENTTALPINIHVYTVHNSELSFSGVINSGEKKAFSNVSECNIEPNSAYNWKLERSYDKNGYQRFKFRNLTATEEENEKLKVTVWNNNIDSDIKLKYKVKAPGAAFETSTYIDKGKSRFIKLYDTDYEFSLENAKLYWKKNIDGTYDKTAKYWAIQRNTTDSPPEWAASPTDPTDKDKVPVFFTITYNKAAKEIIITESPKE